MTKRTEAILREALAKERYSRFEACGGWVDGYVAEMLGEGREGTARGCDWRRCVCFFSACKDHTTTEYLRGYDQGREDARRWLEELDYRLGDGAACEVCGKPTGNRRALYCSPACKQRAYRDRCRGNALGAGVGDRGPARPVQAHV